MENYTEGDYLGQDSTEYLVKKLLERISALEKEVKDARTSLAGAEYASLASRITAIELANRDSTL